MQHRTPDSNPHHQQPRQPPPPSTPTPAEATLPRIPTAHITPEVTDLSPYITLIQSYFQGLKTTPLDPKYIQDKLDEILLTHIEEMISEATPYKVPRPLAISSVCSGIFITATSIASDTLSTASYALMACIALTPLLGMAKTVKDAVSDNSVSCLKTCFARYFLENSAEIHQDAHNLLSELLAALECSLNPLSMSEEHKDSFENLFKAQHKFSETTSIGMANEINNLLDNPTVFGEIALRYVTPISAICVLLSSYYAERVKLFSDNAPRYRHIEVIEQGEQIKELILQARKILEKFEVAPSDRPEFEDSYYNTPSFWDVIMGKCVTRKTKNT